MWSGSIRTNVDPFFQFTDNEVWTALEKAHLKEFVNSLPSKLDHEVGDSGQNIRFEVVISQGFLYIT